MRKDTEARRLVQQYSDLLLRLCTSYLKSPTDAEDICQEVLCKALAHKGGFSSAEHEKAWIIRVACNQCKDLLTSASRRMRAEDTDITEVAGGQEDVYFMPGPVTQALATLPADQRIAIYLFYYEGYLAPDIAHLTNSTTDAIYQRLSRARTTLRALLEGTSHA